MKKLSLVFGAVVGLLLSTSCLAQTASGIDMYQSKIIVKYWRPNDMAHVSSRNMSCFSPQPTMPSSCGAVGSADAPCGFERRLSQLALSPADPADIMEKIVDNTLATGCFQRSGRYRVFLELHDNAGNIAGKINNPDDIPSDVPVLEFDVTPASPAGDTASSFSENCSDGSSLPADGATSSVCRLTLAITDRFSNPVYQLVGASGINFNGDVPTEAGDANEGISFLEGLRLRDGGVWKSFPDLNSPPEAITNITADPTEKVSSSFEVGSIAPSVHQVGPAPEVYDPDAASLAEVLPIPVEFQLSLPTINKDGSLNTSDDYVIVSTDAKLQFIPPFEIFPTATGVNGFVQMSYVEPNSDPVIFRDDYPVSFTFPLQEVDPDAGFMMPNISNVELGGVRMGNGSLGTKLMDADIEDFSGLSFPSKASGALPASTPVTRIVSTPQTDTSNISLGLGALLSYDVNDPLGGTAHVVYPAGGVGSRNDFWNDENGPTINLMNGTTNLLGYHYTSGEKVIGTHIVGGILGTESDLTLDIHTGDSSSVVGQASFDDMRAKITENAYRLRRGADATYILENATSIGATEMALFDSTDVLIVDAHGGTVSLNYGTMPTGNNTLIIFDGNLFIAQEMTYQNPTDSMGFIVINTDLAQGGGQATLTDRRNKGNIWIQNSQAIRRLVGTFFADGGFMSMPALPCLVNGVSSDRVMCGNTDGTNLGDKRSAQLLLTGGLFTRNTLGGSDPNNDAGMFFDPWGESLQDAARIYDLHNVRSYNYQDIVDGDDPSTPGIVENNYNYDHTGFCVPKIGGSPTECIDDNASFVIELDRKVTNPSTTPPGFEIFSTLSH